LGSWGSCLGLLPLEVKRKTFIFPKIMLASHLEHVSLLPCQSQPDKSDIQTNKKRHYY
jgi:hypothetical protein